MKKTCIFTALLCLIFFSFTGCANTEKTENNEERGEAETETTLLPESAGTEEQNEEEVPGLDHAENEDTETEQEEEQEENQKGEWEARQEGEAEPKPGLPDMVNAEGNRVYGPRDVETTNYALYSYNITETDTAGLNEYSYQERSTILWFPQIYFSNQYSEYDWRIEEQINQILFDERSYVITHRDCRDGIEYYSDYEITMANDDIFSIKYYGYYTSFLRARTICYGCTINPYTGERLKVTDFIVIDETLIDRVRSGEIEYESSRGYDLEYVIESIEKFLYYYDLGAENLKNCFFISDHEVNLIVYSAYGDSHYFILKIKI